jgi:uncharacterized membrane protein YbhN (UPF0104 family)
MDKKKWKSVATGVGMIVVLTVIVFLVFRDHWQEIVDNIRGIPIPGVLLLFALAMVYQLLDGAVYHVLIHGQCPGFTYGKALNASFLGVFGRVATLSAGSIPMQSYYLSRCGLMVGKGVGALTLAYAFQKTTILLYTTALLLIQGTWLGAGRSDLARYILLGYLICALIILALILLCTWSRVQKLVLWGIGRIPDRGKWTQRKQTWAAHLDSLYDQSRRLLRDPGSLGKVFALNLGKLCCFYAVPYLSLRMLGVASLSFWQVQFLTALTNLIASALPNVAGVGPTEFAFVFIFSAYMEYAQASSALILYRSATYFFLFLVSIFVFLRVQRRLLAADRATFEQP